MPRYLVKQAFAESIYFGKALCMLGSLRRCCPSGHIHDYRKFDVSLLGMGISRPTFVKYLKILAKKGIIKTTQRTPTNAKNKDKWFRTYDIIIPSNQTLLKMFPMNVDAKRDLKKQNKPKRIKLLYLKNDSNIVENAQMFVIHNKLKMQERKLHHLTDTPLKQDTIHNAVYLCGNVRSVASTNLHREASLSRKEIAKTCGLSDRHSAKRIIDKCIKHNILTETIRLQQIGELSKAQELDIAELKYAMMPRGFYYFDDYDKCWYRRWANGLNLKSEHYGRKQD